MDKYECNLCSKQFLTKGNYLQHLQRLTLCNNTNNLEVIMSLYDNEYSIQDGLARIEKSLTKNYFVQSIQTNTAWNDWKNKFKVIVQLTHKPTPEYAELVNTMSLD